MSKVIDITSKLTNDRAKVKITDDIVVEVDNSKNAIFEVDKIIADESITEIEGIDIALKRLVGEKSFEEIDKLNLTITDYQTVFVAIMAAAMGEDFEVAEARFR